MSSFNSSGESRCGPCGCPETGPGEASKTPPEKPKAIEPERSCTKMKSDKPRKVPWREKTNKPEAGIWGGNRGYALSQTGGCKGGLGGGGYAGGGSGGHEGGYGYSTSFFKNRTFFTRLGALSGAFALAFAYSALREKIKYDNMLKNNCLPSETYVPVLTVKSLRDNFISGNGQHFYSSLAIMAVPLAASKPIVTTSLFLAGVTIFSGSQYYRVFQRKPESLRPLLWLGGLCLMAGWLSFWL